MNILFVPYLTDTQNGFSGVRKCVRAIGNECYAAIAGSVRNHNDRRSDRYSITKIK
jgi:hypothetical protein